MAALRKILFVHDEQSILDTFRASLRKKFKVDTALGPEQGLEKVRSGGPYTVIISDLKMPKMDGITFLSEVQEMAPETVRVMLTGNANLDAPLWSTDGVYFMADGATLTETALKRIANFKKTKKLPKTIQVLVPVDDILD